jgi:hypothetical protein
MARKRADEAPEIAGSFWAPARWYVPEADDWS